jgi:hypothetical protein
MTSELKTSSFDPGIILMSPLLFSSSPENSSLLPSLPLYCLPTCQLLSMAAQYPPRKCLSSKGVQGTSKLPTLPLETVS